MTQPDERECPYCSETIKATAIVCKHCGRELLDQAGMKRVLDARQGKSVPKPASSDQVKSSRLGRVFLLALSIPMVCICFVAILVVNDGLAGPSATPTQDVRTESEKTATAVAISTNEAIAAATEAARPTNTPQPTNTPVPTPTPDGLSRENPVPYGQATLSDEFAMEIVKVEIPSNAFLNRANMFNGNPEEGNSVFMVTVSVTCQRDADASCYISPSDFELFGAKGLVYRRALLTGIDDELDSLEFFGGATTTGWIAFEVDEGDTDLVLAYDPTFDTKLYMQVPTDNVEVLP